MKFPSAGTYTVDAYLSNLQPSPHQEFVVNVKGGGMSPGPGPLVVLAALAGAAWVARRP